MGQLWTKDKAHAADKADKADKPANNVSVNADGEKAPVAPVASSVTDDVIRTPVEVKDEEDDDEDADNSATALIDAGKDEVKTSAATPTSAELLLQKKMKVILVTRFALHS
jgi:hypothetical protein